MSREGWIFTDYPKDIPVVEQTCVSCGEYKPDDECILVCGLCWPCRVEYEAECRAQEEAYYIEHEAHGGSRSFMKSMGICDVCTEFTV